MDSPPPWWLCVLLTASAAWGLGIYLQLPQHSADRLAAALAGLGGCFGLLLAYKGLGAWRQQLRGSGTHECAKGVVEACHHLRRSIVEMRDSRCSDAEIIAASARHGVAGGIATSNESGFLGSLAHLAVLADRLVVVKSALHDLEVAVHLLHSVSGTDSGDAHDNEPDDVGLRGLQGIVRTMSSSLSAFQYQTHGMLGMRLNVGMSDATRDQWADLLDGYAGDRKFYLELQAHLGVVASWASTSLVRM